RDDWCSAALQDRLVNLCFQRGGVVGVRMQRSEKRRGSRKIALSLCYSGLFRQGIHVVRCNIENLIKFSQRFGETTQRAIVNRVLGEQDDVARVEPLGF